LARSGYYGLKPLGQWNPAAQKIDRQLGMRQLGINRFISGGKNQ